MLGGRVWHILISVSYVHHLSYLSFWLKTTSDGSIIGSIIGIFKQFYSLLSCLKCPNLGFVIGTDWDSTNTLMTQKQPCNPAALLYPSLSHQEYHIILFPMLFSYDISILGPVLTSDLKCPGLVTISKLFILWNVLVPVGAVLTISTPSTTWYLFLWWET